MSNNFNECVAVLATLDAQGKCPSAAVLSSVINAQPTSQALPAGCTPANVPGLPGLVYLTNLPPGCAAASIAMAIAEVGQSYSEGSDERKNIQMQVDYVNQWTEVDGFPWISACCPLAKDQSGTLYLDIRKQFVPGTNSLPSKDRNGSPIWATVAAATAHFATQANPSAGGGGGFSPYRGV